MKALLVSLAVGAAFLAGYVSRGWTVPGARAEEEGRWTPDLNGDVNGDGELNLSDAVYILNFCFREGPVPVALPRPRRGLPVTGQRHCWSGTRGELQDPCPQPGMDDFGQDANFLELGIPHDFELVKPDEEDPLTWYTIDHGMGLMWQYRNDERLSWRDALRRVEELELGGFDDWRLPNVKELFAIVDVSVQQPSVDTRFFALTPLAYWSSSTCIFDTSRAYTVRFNNGLVNCTDKGGQGQDAFRLRFLAVRSMD